MIVRKWNWLGLGLVAGLIAVFVIFFMDGLIRRALIRAGQGVAGAKVEIASVHTRLAAGRVDLSGVAIANKNEPMKNLLEFSAAAFELRPRAALEGKVVIREASIEGLRFGTARKTSGALAAAPPSELEQSIKKQLAPVRQNLETAAGDVKSLTVDMTPEKLASLKAVQDARKRLDDVKARWKERLDTSKVQAELREVEASIKELSEKSAGSPADIARKLKQAGEVKTRLERLQKEVELSKNGLTAEFATVNAALAEAKSLKDKDLSALLAAAGLPSFDSASLTRRLLGPAAADKLATAMHWLTWAKDYSRSSAAKAPEKPPRRKGLTVEFPRRESFPGFLLERAKLAGVLDLSGRPLQFTGALEGLTSNPPLYGKPARLVLRGAEAAGPSLDLEARIDGTKEPSSLKVLAEYAGLPVSGWSLGDPELGAELTQGRARIRAELGSGGKMWSGKVSMTAQETVLSPRVAAGGDIGRFAQAALAGIRGFTVDISLQGTPENLQVGLSSDLGSALAQGMKGAFGAQLSEKRKVLEEKLDTLYKAQAASLQKEIQSAQESLLAPLNQQQNAIQQAIKDVISRSHPENPLKGIKLFR